MAYPQAAEIVTEHRVLNFVPQTPHGEEVRTAVEEMSAKSIEAEHPAYKTREAGKVASCETSGKDFQGKVSNSDEWSSGKAISLIRLASNSNTIQLPNLKRHFSKVMKSCQLLSLQRKTQVKGRKRMVCNRLERSSRISPASATSQGQQLFSSRISKTQLIPLTMMNAETDHYNQLW